MADKKIEDLKEVIQKLYCTEGRSKVYISELLGVSRTRLTTYINNIWKLKQASKPYLPPSKQKWWNSNRDFILTNLKKDTLLKDIEKQLSITWSTVMRTYLPLDVEVNKEYQDYMARKSKQATKRMLDRKNASSRQYIKGDLPDEEWKPILGYEDYYISNMGRVKSYAKTYDSFYLLTPYPNVLNGREYVKIQDKNLQVSRLVGHAFIDGYSSTRDTIDHVDGDVSNNKFSNLRWVSQSDNNKFAYQNGRPVVRAGQSNGKFKKIIIDDKYEFKTIVAFAKFYSVSESQAHRYISGETPFNHKIQFVY